MVPSNDTLINTFSCRCFRTLSLEGVSVDEGASVEAVSDVVGLGVVDGGSARVMTVKAVTSSKCPDSVFFNSPVCIHSRFH